MTKISRREFLTTAAAAAAGALIGGVVKAKEPVPVEDIQAVPLDVDVAPVESYAAWSCILDGKIVFTGDLAVGYVYCDPPSSSVW